MGNKSVLKSTYPEYMMIPGVLLFVLLVLVPAASSFYYSFTNWNVTSESAKWIGLKNFKEMFSAVGGMGNLMNNTVTFAVATTLLKTIFGLLLALALNAGLKSTNILRATFFMPMTLSMMLLGIMFKEMLRLDGLFNAGLQFIGLGRFAVSWATNKATAMWVCIAVEVWRASGFAMVIFLAGIQLIPKDIYDAAEIDGANTIQRFFRITLPFLYHGFVLNITLGVISGLKVFDTVYMVTGGGPGRTTEVLSTAVFAAFSRGTYGYSTALGMALFLFVTVVYLVLNSIMKRFEVDIT